MFFVGLLDAPISAQNIEENIRESLQRVHRCLGNFVICPKGRQLSHIPAEVVKSNIKKLHWFLFDQAPPKFLHEFLVSNSLSRGDKYKRSFWHTSTFTILKEQISPELNPTFNAAFLVVQEVEWDSAEQPFPLVVIHHRGVDIDPGLWSKRDDADLAALWQVRQEPENCVSGNLPSLVNIHRLRNVDDENVSFRRSQNKVEIWLLEIGLHKCFGLVLPGLLLRSFEVPVGQDDFFGRFS